MPHVCDIYVDLVRVYSSLDAWLKIKCWERCYKYIIKRSVLNCVLSVTVNEAHLRQSLKY